METSDWIAAFALLIAIISMIGQFWTYKRSERVSERNNEIQAETFRLSKKIDDFENRKGEVLLLNIIGRYFIIHLNYLQTNGRIIQEVDNKKYLTELKHLSTDFNELSNNPYYIKFIEEHPNINLLILSLRGAIIEQENINKHMINPQTFRHFFDMYNILKKGIKNAKILNHEFYNAVDQAANFMMNIVEKQK